MSNLKSYQSEYNFKKTYEIDNEEVTIMYVRRNREIYAYYCVNEKNYILGDPYLDIDEWPKSRITECVRWVKNFKLSNKI